MRSRILLSAVTIVFHCAVLSATIINIPEDYASIQQGINISNDGDTVLVQPGSYIENVNFNGHNVVLGSLFLITEDTSRISQTRLSANSSQYAVQFSQGEDDGCMLIGFTFSNAGNSGGRLIMCRNQSNPKISHNTIKGNYLYDGGGIIIHNSAPSIIGNNFIENATADSGGAIYCERSNALIDDNLFMHNTAFGGGAICCKDADPTISNNVFINNYGDWYGGAIFSCYSSNPVITKNKIVQNETSISGGGICIMSANAQISSNLITANRAMFGVAIYGFQANSTSIINNTISGNYVDPEHYYGGVIFGDNCNYHIVNTVCWGDSLDSLDDLFYLAGCDVSITYSLIQGGYIGYGNIDSDPQFIDPDNGDYHLLAGSPCIDAGDPESPLDPDSTRADIGAFFYDHTVGIDNELVELPSGFSLLQNYPNPFNAGTVISYNLPISGHVIIDIYDVLGRNLLTLVNESQLPGCHRITWKAAGVPSGVYFCKLTADDFSESKKMLLLK